jgi:hypothetical protein
MSAARKPRRNTFKQCDVTRAIKAAFAAGATTARVEIDGRIVVIAENPQIADKATNSANEWDSA